MGLKAVNVRKAEGEFMLIPVDAQCMKRALINFADNAGPDQPAHMRRLIKAFIARLQNQWIL